MDSNTHSRAIVDACMLGGWHSPNYSAIPHVPHIGFAGNDPTDERLVKCCAPVPVNYQPPCTLWCALNPLEAPGEYFYACLAKEGVVLQSAFGSGGHSPTSSKQPAKHPGSWSGEAGSTITPLRIVALVLAIAGGLGLAFAVVQWRSWRWRKADFGGIRKPWWQGTLRDIDIALPAVEQR
ncbi:uncharacterized protein B0I36DRAFT_322176 [Microdochium trichocladiopsis]|uniref:Uncharacterized protein n=1 Tax=Microdochium trichocladiopsis TaxID=1682393 RepID=A0A9P9BQA5_9PEZI|nr:uncharacterized protein B0I36DRAFT_322176 [Microdochium trichocladiopsis]KAH7030648.1 hypothetical protein B0I36DRAFT_322176 [Microdochium trichocladiopsis]